MYTDSLQARRQIALNLSALNYHISPANWQALCMGINRDLQAKKLRPNVPVPSRRQLLSYLKLMRKETGSMLKAILAYGFDGPWTSSGGSFRLARELGFEIPQHIRQVHHKNGSVNYLEIGAAWAGYHPESPVQHEESVAGLAKAFRPLLGQSIRLHFTNLTPWHQALEEGVTEHPWVTASGLPLLEQRGLAAGSVDIIYSQAAAYFEQDFTAFLQGAAKLLRQDGVMLFNHEPNYATEMDDVAWECGLRMVRRRQLGDMNGAVVRYQRFTGSAKTAAKQAETMDDKVVCQSLVMSALRRSAEV
ncbi:MULTISPECIES: hypothetical protein [Enterobacterales]|uniref:hypothetical protein n=1 Tax=Enterobacterales TaxID=91347 RepID=UPI000E072295|nr:MULTISPECIES: hypothetical protein [Serratia]MDW5500041.1 hypothetical protein [Serratia proteamaculans]MDW5505105.1 hypothetical protein [Pseudomonas lundensis]SUI80726.1 Uncharacterised protein [Serratia liquefaciens]